MTKHYLKTKEALIGTFSNLNDARMFISIKIIHDELNRTNILYRMYDDNELLEEFNNNLHECIDPEDAESFNNAQFIFHVTMQQLNSLDRITVAYFNNKEDADLFVTSKCAKEDKSGQGATYFIFKGPVLMATLNRNIIDNKALKELGSSENDRGATLSPLSARPTPPGGPADYWIEKKGSDE